MSSACTLRVGAAGAPHQVAPPTVIRALPAQLSVRELERVSLEAHVAIAPGIAPDARWFAGDNLVPDSPDFSVCHIAVASAHADATHCHVHQQYSKITIHCPIYSIVQYCTIVLVQYNTIHYNRLVHVTAQ